MHQCKCHSNVGSWLVNGTRPHASSSAQQTHTRRAAGREKSACKKWADGGGGHWLVRMEWRPAGWSVCLPLLIFPCTIKSRSSLLALDHPGGPRKRDIKRLCVCVCVCVAPLYSDTPAHRSDLAGSIFDPLCSNFCSALVTSHHVASHPG